MEQQTVNRMKIKFPSKKAQKKQYEIKEDKPFEVHVGKDVYYCTYLKQWTSDQIGYLLVENGDMDGTDLSSILKTMKSNGTTPSKALAYFILNSKEAVEEDYERLWRKLYEQHPIGDMLQGISKIFEAMDMTSFIESIQYLSAMNTWRMKLTQKEQEQLQAEHQSEKKQHS